MNAAVTGGTGFIGQVAVRMLIERGWTVQALSRSDKGDALLRSLGATPIRGELESGEGMGALCDGADVVVHSAARVDMAGRWPEFERLTIDGTQHLLNAAIDAKIPHFVYVSSASVYEPRMDYTSISADQTPTGPKAYNFYSLAKIEAEKLVRSQCEAAGCNWTIVRLGFIYGPGCRWVVDRFIPMLRKKRLVIIGSGENRIASLYVDDAARSLVLAAGAPEAYGKIYDVCSDEPVTQRQFVNALTDAIGMHRTRIRMPRWLVLYFAFWLEKISGLFGPPVHARSMVDLMGAEQPLDAGKIRADLNWKPEMDFAEGMRRMAKWYHDEIASQRAAS